MKVNEYAKAVTGGLVTFGVLFEGATGSGSVGGDGVTSAEWVRIIVGTLVAALGVFLVPNAPPTTQTSSLTVETSTTAPDGYVGEHTPGR
jgi:hypothetical protein